MITGVSGVPHGKSLSRWMHRLPAGLWIREIEANPPLKRTISTKLSDPSFVFEDSISPQQHAGEQDPALWGESSAILGCGRRNSPLFPGLRATYSVGTYRKKVFFTGKKV